MNECILAEENTQRKYSIKTINMIKKMTGTHLPLDPAGTSSDDPVSVA